MSKLTRARRRKLRSTQFAAPKGKGPDKSRNQYPVDTRGRAISAKGRAKQQLNRGKMSRSKFQSIVAKANRVLKRKKGGGRRIKRGRRRAR